VASPVYKRQGSNGEDTHDSSLIASEMAQTVIADQFPGAILEDTLKINQIKIDSIGVESLIPDILLNG